MKQATQTLVLTKAGQVSKSITNMIRNCHIDSASNRIYTGYYSGSGRFTSAHSAMSTIVRILKAEELPYIEGNDAPRGGISGEYVQVSPEAIQFITSLTK